MAKLFSADNVIMYANLSICLHLFGGSSVAVAEDAFGDRHPRSASEPSQSPVMDGAPRPALSSCDLTRLHPLSSREKINRTLLPVKSSPIAGGHRSSSDDVIFAV